MTLNPKLPHSLHSIFRSCFLGRRTTEIMLCSIKTPWDSAGGPVVTVPCFQSRGCGLIPNQTQLSNWTKLKIPQAEWCGQKKKKISAPYQEACGSASCHPGDVKLGLLVTLVLASFLYLNSPSPFVRDLYVVGRLSEIMSISCSLSNLHGLLLMDQPPLCLLPNGDFLFPSFLLHGFVGFLS